MTDARYAHRLCCERPQRAPNSPSTTGGKAVLVIGGAGGAIDGAEVLVRTDGEPCVLDEECLSGICAAAPTLADPGRQVCCNDRCDEECFSCSGEPNVPASDRVFAAPIDDHALPTTLIPCGTDQTGEDDVEVHTACDGTGQVKVTGTTV